jgi:hypothetical protein
MRVVAGDALPSLPDQWEGITFPLTTPRSGSTSIAPCCPPSTTSPPPAPTTRQSADVVDLAQGVRSGDDRGGCSKKKKARRKSSRPCDVAGACDKYRDASDIQRTSGNLDLRSIASPAASGTPPGESTEAGAAAPLRVLPGRTLPGDGIRNGGGREGTRTGELGGESTIALGDRLISTTLQDLEVPEEAAHEGEHDAPTSAPLQGEEEIADVLRAAAYDQPGAARALRTHGWTAPLVR